MLQTKQMFKFEGIITKWPKHKTKALKKMQQTIIEHEIFLPSFNVFISGRISATYAE